MLPSPALDPSRPHINVAILGHAGHGKSRLLSALTARSFVHPSRPWAKTTSHLVFVDVLPYKVRGELVRRPRTAMVEFESPFRHYDALDAPGARRLCDAALAACSAADVVILVVSALDGALAQTREHALFARAVGVSTVIVFMSHCDRVSDPAQLDLAENDVREVLTDAGYSGDLAPVVRGATIDDAAGQWAATVDDLIATIDREVSDPARDVDGAVRATVLWRYDKTFPKDRVALVHVTRGTIRRADKLVVVGRRGTERLNVTDIRVFDRQVDSIAAGDIATLRLAAVGEAPVWRRVLHRGAVLVARFESNRTRVAEVSLRLLTQSEGGRHTDVASGFRGAMCFGSTKVTARFVLPPRVERLRPGESASGVMAELQWLPAIDTPARFLLRDGTDGLQRKFGGGSKWSGTCAVGTLDRWRVAPSAT